MIFFQKVLYLAGNPVIRNIPNYRKTMIVTLVGTITGSFWKLMSGEKFFVIIIMILKIKNYDNDKHNIDIGKSSHLY